MRLSVIRNLDIERRIIDGTESNLSLGEPLVITSAEINDEIADRIVKDNPNLTWRQYKFDGGICYVFCDKSFDFPKIPYGSGSGTRSQARYLARRGRPFEGLLVQILDSGSHTSAHEHHRQIEVYFPLEGDCIVHVDDENHPLKNHIIVQPHEWHQVTTDKMPSLAFIAMLGNEDSLSQDDHHHTRCPDH